MLSEVRFENILFLDIETVPLCADYDGCPEPFRALWEKKCTYLRQDPDETPASLWQRAGIYAEFGKVVCISVAFFREGRLRVKSFADHDESKLLGEFCALLSNHFNRPSQLLCAHNGKEFDFPYLSRRILVNGLPLPAMLDTAGLKPWQVQHLDTMELWKFGDYKSYTSLELLAALFGIPTPKDDISGSDIARVYWAEQDLARIVHYCQKDVVTVAQLLLRYKGMPLLKEEQIHLVETGFDKG